MEVEAAGAQILRLPLCLECSAAGDIHAQLYPTLVQGCPAAGDHLYAPILPPLKYLTVSWYLSVHLH